MSNVLKVDVKTRRVTRVDTWVSRDTVDTLRDLLAQAERGEVIGLSFVALGPLRHFITHSCGECGRNPVQAAGMVGHLLLDLQLQARGDR
jgi:hypothetical protein